MKVVSGFLWTVILLAASARALLFVGVCFVEMQSPMEAFHLEGSMSHRCERVQRGLKLYPDWRQLPHVANFFTPGYFLLVGKLAKSFELTRDSIVALGRWVSIASVAGLSILATAISLRRYGRGAAAVTFLFSVGSAPAIGFGYVVRPDALADFLGLCGFVAACSAGPFWIAAGAGVLATACFVKQTAVAYLVAACTAILAGGNRSKAVGLLIATSTLFGLFGMTYATLAGEPRYWNDIFGERFLPWNGGHWLAICGKLLKWAPELVLLCLVAIADRRIDLDRRWAILAGVVVIFGLASSAKLGSDLNYFLAWRIPAAITAGALWKGRDQRILPAAILLACMYFSVGMHLSAAAVAQRDWSIFHSVEGGPVREQLKAIERLGVDPSRKVLTDVGRIAFKQGQNAAFVDPWLFRYLVLCGQLQPTELAQRLETEYYDALILSADLFDVNFDALPFALPPPLSAVARTHYLPAGVQGGCFLFVPKRISDASANGAESPNRPRP